jgi:hypothetical protein
MGALRPLKDEEIEILAKFIKLNKDKEEDIKYIYGVIDGMVHLYVFSGFVDIWFTFAAKTETYDLLFLRNR